LQHGGEGRQSVAGIAHKRCEPFEIILWTGGLAVAPLDRAQLIVVIGNELGLGGPLPPRIQQLTQAIDRAQPTARLGDRQVAQAADEVGRFLAGEQPELSFGGRAD